MLYLKLKGKAKDISTTLQLLATLYTGLRSMGN